MQNRNNSANSSQAHDGRDDSRTLMVNSRRNANRSSTQDMVNPMDANPNSSLPLVNPNGAHPNSSLPPVNPNDVDSTTIFPPAYTVDMANSNDRSWPNDLANPANSLPPVDNGMTNLPACVNFDDSLPYGDFLDEDDIVNLGDLLDPEDDFRTDFNDLLPDNEVKLNRPLNPISTSSPRHKGVTNRNGHSSQLYDGDNSSQAYDNVIGSRSYHNQVHNDPSYAISTWPQTVYNGVAKRMHNGNCSSQPNDGGSSSGAYEESTILVLDNGSSQANNNVIGLGSYWNQVHNDPLNVFSSSSQMMPNAVVNRNGSNSSQANHDQNMIGSSHYMNQVHKGPFNPINTSLQMMHNGMANRNGGNSSRLYNGSSSSGVHEELMNPFFQAYRPQNVIASSNNSNQMHDGPLNPINTSFQVMHNGVANRNGGNSSQLYNGSSSSGAHEELMNPSFQANRPQNMIASSSNSKQTHNGMDNFNNNLINMRRNGGLDPAEVQRVFDRLPIGYRFRPTDLDLVVLYLIKKVHGQPLAANIIPSFDVYSMSPSKLTRLFNPLSKSEWYFFCPRRKKHPKGKIPDRSTPGGYWKARGKEQDIPPQPQSRLAIKRTLDFFEGKHPKGQKTKWKKHEYVLKNDSDNGECSHTAATKPNDKMLLDECVLYKIYKTNRNSGGKSDGGTSDNENPDD